MSPAAPHDPETCAGRPCAWHCPSDHHMRSWPRTWSGHHAYSLRRCAHGIGHPDPDDIIDLQSVGGVSAAHPCDGCCIAPMRDIH